MRETTIVADSVAGGRKKRVDCYACDGRRPGYSSASNGQVINCSALLASSITGAIHQT